MNKDTYTKVFLTQAEIQLSEENLKMFHRKLWQNTRTKSTGGLRLTDEGLEFLHETLGLVTYEIDFPLGFDLNAKVTIWLDQLLDCPYYLTDRSITVLSERKSIELHLFSGDVLRYGQTKAMTRDRAVPSLRADPKQ